MPAKNSKGRPVLTGKYDAQVHPQKLIELRSQGKLHMQVLAAFKISKSTYYEWKSAHEEFKKADEESEGLAESWWTDEMVKKFLDGNDKGYKYASMIMTNCFNWNQQKINQAVTNNTQINVQGGFNVLQAKTSEELVKLLSDDFQFLQRNKVIPAEFKVITDDSSQSDEQN